MDEGMDRPLAEEFALQAEEHAWTARNDTSYESVRLAGADEREWVAIRLEAFARYLREAWDRDRADPLAVAGPVTLTDDTSGLTLDQVRRLG